MSGPPPTPRSLLALRGSWRAVERAKAGEPDAVPLAAPPDPPADMAPDAAAVWRRQLPALLAMGVIGAGDLEGYAVACEAYAAWKAAHAAGHTKAALGYARLWMSMSDRYGMTPAARAKVRADKPGGQSRQSGVA